MPKIALLHCHTGSQILPCNLIEYLTYKITEVNIWNMSFYERHNFETYNLADMTFLTYEGHDTFKSQIQPISKKFKPGNRL